MKRILFILIVISALCCSMRSDDCISKDGYFRGKRLCGRVKIVDSLADFKVKVVGSLADLHVRVVDGIANDPGEWRFVESGQDFSVRFVESGEDFTIRYVESLPGVNRPCR